MIPFEADGQTYYLYVVKCCREWEVALGFKVGRCGYCGERPHA